MKVVILGSKGMLGRVLKEEFAKDSEVFAYDKEELDITDKNQLEIIFKEVKPDLVINATAYNAVDKIEESSEDYKLAEMINGYAVGYLAEVCKKLDIVLVHYSSDYIFKGINKFGYSETDMVDSVNKYGETKALGENFLKTNAEKYYLIRLSRLFGQAGTSEMSKKSFVDVMLDLVVNKGKTVLDLVDDEKSSPTYSKDLAHLTRYIVESKQPFGIYHGANSGACTWYEFAQEIFKIKNLTVKCNPVSADYFPRPARRPNYSELLNNKLPKQRTWQEGLKDYLN